MLEAEGTPPASTYPVDKSTCEILWVCFNSDMTLQELLRKAIGDVKQHEKRLRIESARIDAWIAYEQLSPFWKRLARPPKELFEITPEIDEDSSLV